MEEDQRFQMRGLREEINGLNAIQQIGARGSQKRFQIPGQRGWITAEVGKKFRRFTENGSDNAFLQSTPRWIHHQRFTAGQVIAEQIRNITRAETALAGEAVVQGIASSLLNGSGIELKSDNPESFTGKRETDGSDSAIGVHNGCRGEVGGEPSAQHMHDALGLGGVDLEKGCAAESQIKSTEALEDRLNTRKTTCFATEDKIVRLWLEVQADPFDGIPSMQPSLSQLPDSR